MFPKMAIPSLIILIIIVSGLTGWVIYFHQPTKKGPTSIEPYRSSVVSDEKEAPKTIAVLPFENLSPEKDQEYFANGIAEELINSLTRISGLEVRGHTSSFYFKGKNETSRTISKMLNVEYLLEGSVRKSGKQIRIAVQLIDPRKDAHIWSKTYDRTMDDIFVIQDDIAQSVAEALQITLGIGELGHKPGMTNNIAAYDAYLAGLSLISKYGRDNISQAIEQLKQAVALDPDFATGWSALAYAYESANNVMPEKSEEWSVKQKEASSRANKLFLEHFPESDVALRIAAQLSGDRMEEERLYNKALAVAPANNDTNGSYGWFLLYAGRPTEAIDYFKRCVQLEPLDSTAHLYLGVAYELSGKLDDAAITYKKAKEMTNDPTFFNICLLVLAMTEKNRALIYEYFQPTGWDQFMPTPFDKSEDALAKLRRQLSYTANKNAPNRQVIALMASYFGDNELALQIFRELPSRYQYLAWRPIYKGMRRLPGFKDLVQKIGLVDYWRKSGKWGDYCHPVGKDDFECD